MNAAWQMVHLSEIAVPVSRPVTVTAGVQYRTIGVKWWGEGAYERQTIDGSETAAQTLFLVHKDDLIINKIWVRHGSTAIASDAVDGCAASNEFPTFELDRARVLPRWLHWLTKTKPFWKECDKLSRGTSGKNRIKPELFLTIEVPLPPLEEQQRIVQRVEELSVKIEEARKLRRQSVEEAKLLMGSVLQGLLEDIPRSNWVPLSRFIQEIENGLSPACENRPASDDEWGVVKVGAVSFGVFNPWQNKALPSSLSPLSCYEIHSGDFLMSRANTTELVGACALVEKTRTKLMLSDKIFRFIFRKDSPLERRYLNYVLKSPALRSQIEKKATGTSPTMKNISKEKVLGLLLPPHSIFDQQCIVAQLDNAQSRVQSLNSLQAETTEELNALLPSVLDKAFKGEL